VGAQEIGRSSLTAKRLPTSVAALYFVPAGLQNRNCHEHEYVRLARVREGVCRLPRRGFRTKARALLFEDLACGPSLRCSRALPDLYCTAIVAVFDVEPPIETVNGTDGPVAASAGIVAFT
jgi:hypothetical protein